MRLAGGRRLLVRLDDDGSAAAAATGAAAGARGRFRVFRFRSSSSASSRSWSSRAVCNFSAAAAAAPAAGILFAAGGARADARENRVGVRVCEDSVHFEDLCLVPFFFPPVCFEFFCSKKTKIKTNPLLPPPPATSCVCLLLTGPPIVLFLKFVHPTLHTTLHGKSGQKRWTQLILFFSVFRLEGKKTEKNKKKKTKTMK